VVHSHPGLESSIVQDSPCIQGKGRTDYDSGNDTSSPPLSKTGVSRTQDTADRQEKLKFLDNSSDSGNSLSSYGSLSKAEHRERHVNTSAFNKLKSEESSSCFGFMSHHSPSAVKSQFRSETRSRSRSRSSRSSRHWGRHISRSRSPSSSRRSYSRSSSYSCDSRRSSVCSVSSRRSGKRSRYTPDRIRERRRSSGSCEKPSKRSRKRSRRRICSPMRKRRRDSPSHLEARRITSARKRPIPYYRPSPSSSSSRSSSLSSWSLFSLTRSPSLSRGRSRSRSSYRSYTRSTSLSSIYSSRSYDTLVSYNRARR
ncbi:serine/arginine repetitive matrix protein 4, partial [Tachysurus ichikawai]